MGMLLHQEFDATVISVRPWGLEVEFQDRIPGLIDNTKDPEWPSGDRSSIVGRSLRVAVIDDERIPVRLSALPVDLEIARNKRSIG